VRVVVCRFQCENNHQSTQNQRFNLALAEVADDRNLTIDNLQLFFLPVDLLTLSAFVFDSLAHKDLFFCDSARVHVEMIRANIQLLLNREAIEKINHNLR